MSVTDLLHPAPVLAETRRDTDTRDTDPKVAGVRSFSLLLLAGSAAGVLGTASPASEPGASDYDDDEDEDYFYDDDDDDEDDLDDDFDDDEEEEDDEDEEEDDDI